jgi:hypothetical protein
MPTRSSKGIPRDINQNAARIVALSTGQPIPKLSPEATRPKKNRIRSDEREKNPAAVALGRLGGQKGGIARANRLTAEQRKEIAKRAADARWSRQSEKS